MRLGRHLGHTGRLKTILRNKVVLHILTSHLINRLPNRMPISKRFFSLNRRQIAFICVHGRYEIGGWRSWVKDSLVCWVFCSANRWVVFGFWGDRDRHKRIFVPTQQELFRLITSVPDELGWHLCYIILLISNGWLIFGKNLAVTVILFIIHVVFEPGPLLSDRVDVGHQGDIFVTPYDLFFWHHFLIVFRVLTTPSNRSFGLDYIFVAIPVQEIFSFELTLQIKQLSFILFYVRKFILLLWLLLLHNTFRVHLLG